MNFSIKFLIITGLLLIALISGTTWGLAQGPPDNPGPPGRTLASLNCSADQIAKFDGYEWACAEDLTPSPGTVMFFDLDSCPEGWSEPAETKGRALVALPAAGTPGGSIGNPLGNLEDRAHSHQIDPAGIETHRSGVHRHEGSADDAGLHNHTAETDLAGLHSHQANTGIVEGHSHNGNTDDSDGHSHRASTNIGGVHSHEALTDGASSHSHSGSTGAGSAGTNKVEHVPDLLPFPDLPGIPEIDPEFNFLPVARPSHTHNLYTATQGNHTHAIDETSSTGAHDHTVSTNQVDDHSHLLATSGTEVHAHSIAIISPESHNHSANTSYGGDHSHAVSTDDSSDHNHTVDIPGTVSTNAATSNVVPYIQLLLCRKD